MKGKDHWEDLVVDGTMIYKSGS